MKIELQEVSTRETRTYQLTDAPDVKLPYVTIIIRPDWLTVTIYEGEVSGVALNGPRVLKAGLSESRRSAQWSAWRIKDAAPSWLAEFLFDEGLVLGDD